MELDNTKVVDPTKTTEDAGVSSTTKLDDPTLTNVDTTTPEPVDPAEVEKKEIDTPKPTGNDFYDNFKAAQRQTEFVSDMQSADTYWNNRPEERKQYETQYGDKAREVFDSKYAEVEKLWRQKLETHTDVVTINAKYDWLFDKDPEVSYANDVVFDTIHEAATGSKLLGDYTTDKQRSMRQAAIAAKTIKNDSGDLVKLKDDEKWWSFSTGTGTVMNNDDPRFKSKKDKKIVGFQYENFPDDYRGDLYLKAIYEGDTPTGEVVSQWDTTGCWLLTNNQLNPDKLIGAMIPKLAVRSTVNLAADMVTGTISLINSAANLLDIDDSGNEFIDKTNNIVTGFKQAKFSKSDYDQSKVMTTTNFLDLVANVYLQLKSGKIIFNGAGKVARMLSAESTLLKEAKALEKAGKFAEAGVKNLEYDMKIGKAARGASLIGLTVATGDSVVTEARAAGFNEDEVATIYLAYFGAMLAANNITERFINPYIDDAAIAPLIKDTIKKRVGLFAGAKTEAAKFSVAKGLVNSISNAIEKFPSLGALAGHTPRALTMQSILYKGLNEAIEEEAEWLGQEVVELGATVISKRQHAGEKDIPKFDIFTDDGYWARQLPNIAMSALGGFMGGAMTHFDSDFQNNTEQSFLIKGKEDEKLFRIALVGGNAEKQLFKMIPKMMKSGALGSNELSVKINDKTGEYYKMTDKEAEGSISQAEAAKRAILYQYGIYKAAYGGANQSFDEIIKSDPTLAAELNSGFSGASHVLHRDLTDLHKTKQTILNRLRPKEQAVDKATIEAKKKQDKQAPEKKATEPIVVEDTSRTPGVTQKPTDEEDAKALQNYSKEFKAAVLERAALIGTSNLADVADLIKVETRIDDILSGKAAAQHIVKGIIRTKGINVFAGGADQQAALTSTMGSDGKPIPNKFAALGEQLLDMIFSADINLAKGYEGTHKDYLESKDIVDKAIKSLTEERLEELATRARRFPNSIAIDRDTDQIAILREGVTKLVDKLISKEEFATLVTNARIALNLDPTKETKDYRMEFTMSCIDYIANNHPEYLDVQYDEDGVPTADPKGLLPEDILRSMLKDNALLAQQLSMSALLDEMSISPSELLVAKLNTNLEKFASTLADDLVSRQTVTALEKATERDDSEIITAQQTIAKLTTELEELKAKEAKTDIEQLTIQDNINKLKELLTKARADYGSAVFAQRASGPLWEVVEYYGPYVLQDISVTSKPEDLTPLVKIVTPTISKAIGLFHDYDTIITNIAPAVPPIQTLGAVFNLLNTLTTDGITVKSNSDKIISTRKQNIILTTLADGTIVNSVLQPSLVDQLKASKVSDDEFRDLEGAKQAMDMINLRLGQVQVLAEVQDKLGVLRRYTQEHVPPSDNRYDKLPKFMAEYVFDSVRYTHLKNKATKTEAEKVEFNEMDTRAAYLLTKEHPDSIHGRLMDAKAEVQKLIDLGEKSLSKDERFRIYKKDLAEQLNEARVYFSNNLGDTSEELTKAIATFISVTDKYNDSNDVMLVEGKKELDNVLEALYRLPDAVKLNILSSGSNFELNSRNIKATKNASNANAFRNVIASSILTNVTNFNKYYKEVLTERAAQPDMMAPTYSQEKMIRFIFSFLTDESNLYSKLSVKFPEFVFADGGSGTGKTTMIGYAIAAAQKFNDAKLAAKGVTNLENVNKVLWAAPYQHQANTIKRRTEGIGVTKGEGTTLTKPELFKILENPSALPQVSTIVIDEATFIQAPSPESIDITELDVLHDRIATINLGREHNPIKVVMVGSTEQGGWETGMETVMNPNLDGSAMDYSKFTGDKRNLTKSPAFVPSTDPLTYVFRSLCDRVSEISKMFLRASKYLDAVFSNTEVTKITISHGVMNNDTRGRIGGAKTVKSSEALYNDEALVISIKKQIDLDKTSNINNPDKIFSVIIVDDEITALEKIPGALGELIKGNEKHFKLFNTFSVQGTEADYVVANIAHLIPNLPIRASAIDANKMERAAMVIARARLFTIMTANPDIPIISTPDAAISMLLEADAAQLSSAWTEFYVGKLWGAGNVNTEAKPYVAPEEIKTESKPATTTEPKSEIKLESTVVAPPAVDPTSLVVTGGANIVPGETTILPTSIVTVVEREILDTDEANKLNAKLEAIQKSDTTDEAKAEAKVKQSQIAETHVELVDIFDESNPTTDIITTELFDQKQEELEESDEDIKSPELRAIQKNGSSILFTKISSSAPLSEQTTKMAQYASDLWGKTPYKTERGHIKTDARLRINEIKKAIQNMDSGTVPDLAFSLVSYQVFSRSKKDPIGKDVIVHLLYASDGVVKVPVGMLPRTTIGTTGALNDELTARESRILKAVEVLKILENREETKHLFVDVDSKRTALGKAGLPLRNDVIDALNGMVGTKTLEQNDDKTSLGRTAVSDEVGYNTRFDKISIDNINTGLFFLETKLEKTDKIFQALSPGKPLRSSDESLISYVENTGGENSPSRHDLVGSGFFESDLTKALQIRREGKQYEEKVTGKTIVEMGQSFVHHWDTGKPILAVKIKDTTYNIISFKDNKTDRVIPVAFKGKEMKFAIPLGFDANGNMIVADKELLADKEYEQIAFLLKNPPKFTAEQMIELSTPGTLEQIREHLASVYSYSNAEVDAISTVDQKQREMSKVILQRKIRNFSDTQIPYTEFKKLAENRNVQISKPLIITRGTHQGKITVLYTFRDKSKIDLSKESHIAQFLTGLSRTKPSEMSAEDFSIKKIAKQGVGLIMMDSKNTSFEELLPIHQNNVEEDFGRASTPVNSAANRRMVAFIKELTELSFAANPMASYQVSHTRLAQMGIENGAAIETIFDNKAKESIRKLLIAPENKTVADRLHTLLYNITRDENLGMAAILNSELPAEIQHMFSEHGKERADIWLGVVKYSKNPKVQEYIKKYNLSETNLYTYAALPTDLADKMNAKVSGNILINSTTHKPIILNRYKNAVTFLPSELLNTKTSAGVFHLPHFMSGLLNGNTDLEARELAMFIDKIMTTYSSEGTLRKGLPWTGKLSNAFSNIGFSLMTTDTNSGLNILTSVKDFNPPAIYISIKGLIDELHASSTPTLVERVTAAFTSNVEEGPEIVKDEIRAAFNKKKADLASQQLTKAQLEAAKNSALRDVAQEFSEKINMFGKEILSIMELEEEFTNAINSMNTVQDILESQSPAMVGSISLFEASENYAKTSKETKEFLGKLAARIDRGELELSASELDSIPLLISRLQGHELTEEQSTKSQDIDNILRIKLYRLGMSVSDYNQAMNELSQDICPF